MFRAFYLAVAVAGLIAAQTQPGTVLVVGIDGFRPDFANRPQAKNLRQFRDQSIRSQYLAPEFPSVTFPNFYSMVTGLVPGRHGIVGMSFYDPDRKASFDYRNSKDGSWFQGEPIWNRAEKQGIRTATYFWVGSEWPIHGGQPSIWFPYDGRVPHAKRIAEAERWLRLPTSERPRLMMIYFSAIDSAVHRTGTESPETAAALADVDTAFGLLAGKAKEVLPDIHVVVVSDHGAANNQGILDLSRAADISGCEVRNDPPLTRIWCANSQKVGQVQAQLKSAKQQVNIFTLQDAPAHWKLQGNRRNGDLIIEPAGLQMTSIVPPGTKVDPAPSIPGMHGYDASRFPEMRGILWAQGPMFRGVPGDVSPARTPDVYLVIARILGLSPAQDLDAVDSRIADLFRSDGLTPN